MDKKNQDLVEEGLENEKKSGNNFSALHISKNLTKLERLKRELMKKDIEIERLKKDTKRKEFVTTKGHNTK